MFGSMQAYSKQASFKLNKKQVSKYVQSLWKPIRICHIKVKVTLEFYILKFRKNSAYKSSDKWRQKPVLAFSKIIGTSLIHTRLPFHTFMMEIEPILVMLVHIYTWNI